MERDLFSITIRALTVLAIGFGLVVYLVPPKKVIQFRALINSGPSLIDSAIHPKNDKPEAQPMERPQATASAEIKTTRRQADPDVSFQHQSGADSGCDSRDLKCAGESPATDIPSHNSAAPTDLPVESSNNQPAPIMLNAEPAFVPTAMTSSVESVEKTPVAKRNHAKAPAKKAKRKKNSAEQLPTNELTEPTPPI